MAYIDLPIIDSDIISQQNESIYLGNINNTVEISFGSSD
jgi:hypothetical protein